MNKGCLRNFLERLSNGSDLPDLSEIESDDEENESKSPNESKKRILCFNFIFI